MLHFGVKEKPCFWLFFLLCVPLLPFCKREAAEQQDEEEIYLADYEPPAHPWGYMDSTGNLVIEAVFDDAGLFSEGLAAVNRAGRWGYINRSGQIIIEPTYKAAWAFHEGMARVSPFSGNEHYVTSTGRIVSSDMWSAADDFSEGLAKVKVGNRFGFIDTSGQIVLRALYSRCKRFESGLAVISTDEKLGLIDYQGNEILPQQFHSIKMLGASDLILANTENGSIIYDFNGLELHRLPGITVVDSDGKVVSVQNEDFMFFMDLEDGKILKGPGWKNLQYLGEERWAAKQDTSFFLLNNKGEKVSVKPFTQINKFVDGYAAYFTGEHWGYMDRDGKDLSPEVFGLAWDYKNGFARAAFSEGIAFINRQLKLAFYPPPGTMEMRDFSEGLAPVQIGDH